MSQPGDRVGAILSAVKNEVRLLGYGVYDGEQDAPESAFEGFMGMTVEEIKRQIPDFFPRTNPRITLDDGRVVWGCQCWWGSEEEVKRVCAGRKVTIVDIHGDPLKQEEPA